MSVTAKWNGKEIARSDNTVIVEGNHYFPREDVDESVFSDSPLHTTCPWKGEASYYSINIDGQVNNDAAWYYPSPKEAAQQITNRIAFWKGVEINEE